MLFIGSLYRNFVGRVVCAAGSARARDLHDLCVMSAQTDVPFRWHERLSIQAKVWVYDRICGPIC